MDLLRNGFLFLCLNAEEYEDGDGILCFLAAIVL